MIGANDGSTPKQPETPSDPSAVILFARDRDFVEQEKLLDQIYKKYAVSDFQIALVDLNSVK